MVPAVPGGRIPVGHEHLRPFLLEARPQKLQSQRTNAENQLEGEREFPERDPGAGEKWEPGSSKWERRVGVVFFASSFPAESCWGVFGLDVSQQQ